jgi:hypothetical protein
MRRIVSILVFLGAFPLQSLAASPDYKLTKVGFCSGTLNEQRKKTCMNASLQLCGNPDVPSCEVSPPNPTGMDDDSKQKTCGATVAEANASCQSKTLRAPPTVKDGGTREICEQYNTEVLNAQSQNEYQAGRCRAAIANCLATCTQLRSNPEPLYNGNIDKCKDLVKNAETLEKQMEALANGSLKAMDCSKLSSADTGSSSGSGDSTGKKDSSQAKSTSSNPLGGLNPQALMQLMQAMNQNQEDPTQAQPPAFQDCSANPSIAGCVQPASLPQSWNQTTGATSASDTDNSGGEFNPADISGMQPASVNDQQQRQFGTPATTASVPNGGGQMLGGGGGGSSASLGGAQPASYGGNPSKKVEVQTGSGGGGYSQTAAGMNLKNGEGGGGYTYGGRNPSSDSNFDLSSFLPGGKHDPFKGRNVAGTASGTGNFQIQSKDVNLFSRISERIKSRCAQGLLRDCIP